MIVIIPNPTKELAANLKFFDEVIALDDKEKDTIIKGLRLILLVGADHETMIASNLLDILLPTA